MLDFHGDYMLKTQQQAVRVGGATLNIQDVIVVANSKRPMIQLADGITGRLDEVRQYVEERVNAAVSGTGERAGDKGKRTAIYGVTTGFGALKTRSLPDTAAALRLQENIILSHSSGTGMPFNDKVVRAVMVLRAHTLAKGYSGVRLELLEHLVQMLNCDVLPIIPEQGSVGCSGDLAPLAHLALSLIGKGGVRFNGTQYASLSCLKEEVPDNQDLRALRHEFSLSYKEGLALVNGISVTTALAALNFDWASRLLAWADVIGSMTAEAVLGAPRAFDKIVFDLIYRHKGATISAETVRKMTRGSTLLNDSEDVHDPYSVRCIPQVHGAVRDTLRFVESAVQNHLDTVDDDPVFFTSAEVSRREFLPFDGWLDRLHFEDGHFHGVPVGYAMDFMAIAMADLGSMSERRIAMLVDRNHNRGGEEVPGFLTYDPDNTTSGVMLAQYTAASLASENKILAHPASVDSIPTSANHEDHVSMSTIAARKARTILGNVETVLAIELLCTSLALAFRMGQLKNGPNKQRKERTMGVGTAEIYEEAKRSLNDFAAFVEEDKQRGHRMRDCIIHLQIDSLKKLLQSPPPTTVLSDVQGHKHAAGV
jgi:histidine ammonia-lyase